MTLSVPVWRFWLAKHWTNTAYIAELDPFSWEHVKDLGMLISKLGGWKEGREEGKDQ